MACVRLLAVSLLTTSVVATLGEPQSCATATVESAVAAANAIAAEAAAVAACDSGLAPVAVSLLTTSVVATLGDNQSCATAETESAVAEAEAAAAESIAAAACEWPWGDSQSCATAEVESALAGANAIAAEAAAVVACRSGGQPLTYDYDDKHTPFWSAWGYGSCRNRHGVLFPCGPDGKCCGDICAAKGDKCCKNSNDNDFACSGSCCGNACAAEGSKCCSLANGYEYPATDGTACSGDYVTCMNRDHTKFYCGAHSTCCGDICVGEGSACCENSMGNNFACGAASSCCGNACAGPNSKCCEPEGRPMSEWYPVFEGTMCRA